MKWFDDYKEDLEAIFAEAARLISSFPAPLQEMGLHYLEKSNPLLTESSNYVCYLLPFWLQKATEAERSDCRRLGMAGVFMMLHYCLLDDVMDSPEQRGWHKTLALGHLCYIEYERVYRELFPACSPFWHAFNRYSAEWAEAVSMEQEQDFFLSERIKIAHKASPVKLSGVGAAYLGGTDHLLPDITAAVETVLVTLQMSDDAEDWEKDLREGSYNCLLSWIRSITDRPSGAPLTPDEVRQAITVSDALQGYAAIASENHARLQRLSVASPHLLAFHQAMAESLRQEAEYIYEERNKLMSGGFSYILSNLAK
ncbi:methionine synthase I [Paenibacillus thiaminolyticus]|uniref:methionine synthase I n=1 Tax=Paenibacillus thiaminolyticus TaxID=49283 RepID=UPI00234FCD17|nr:methionine synthase I [Paenibacillus thiaminolyticus]MDG0872081.1 methionine synthase I [Paenibacillus thiaminolyticus]WCR24833.1 methionine synthase I [Paenibacillus thiaminolyticus]